jgi:hypothetical protein
VGYSVYRVPTPTVEWLKIDATRTRQEATRVRTTLAATSSSVFAVETPPPPTPHNHDDVFRAYFATQANVAVAALHA